MLVKLKESDFEWFVKQAYPMALIPEITGYPAYFDGIKTREDFAERARKAFSRDNEEILLFYEGDVFSGWVHYYYLAEDEYLQPSSLGARSGMERMLGEFLDFAVEKFPKATLYLGFPEENRTALRFLQAQGFEVGEESWNMVLHLPDRAASAPVKGEIVPIDRENYPLFRKLHAQHDGEMYWDSAHILDALDEWLLFVLLEKGEPAGAIYFMRGELGEIFGVDYPGGHYAPDVHAKLLAAVIEAARRDGCVDIVHFCDEEREKRTLTGAGFRCVGKYVMVKRAASGYGPR